MFSKVDAVYIASPHQTHADYIRQALEADKHVLCEKPIVLSVAEAQELYRLATGKDLILMEAIKTAYAPAFHKLMAIMKSGAIGKIKDVDASFTKLVSGDLRELSSDQAGGSVTELATYPLLPIVKLLGTDYKDLKFYPYIKNGVDLFTRGIVEYKDAVGSFKVGLGVKTEGSLIISGTKGYAYVPAPWWLTDYFEIRYEDLNKTRKYFERFEDSGLRYEINEFLSLINEPDRNFLKVTEEESISIIKIIERFTRSL